MRVLVTGADGFIGSALCHWLQKSGHSVRAAVRSPKPGFHFRNEAGEEDLCVTGDIGGNPPWHKILPGVDVVFHLAALVHQTGKLPALEAYCRVNATGTEQLARACVQCGAHRIVFLSSLSVNAGRAYGGVFTEEDAPAPRDHYGISKLKAEQLLEQVSQNGNLETVIVRPPLVYGPGVPANFFRLMEIVRRMNPLLIPRLRSKRSMVGIDNLVDMLAVCAVHPRAAGQVFLVSDNEDITVSDLIERLARAMNRSAFTIPAPEGLIRFAAKVTGKQEDFRRLADPLVVSPRKAIELLGWVPPFDLNYGLARTVEWYIRSGIA